MKKLIRLYLAAIAAAATASAGTVTVDSSAPVLTPSSAFSNTTLKATVANNNLADMTGETTIALPNSGSVTLSFTGNYTASGGDFGSIAYYFVADLNAPGTVTCVAQGSANVFGSNVTFSKTETIPPGQHIFSGQKSSPAVPGSTSGTYSATVTITYTPPPTTDGVKAATAPTLYLRFDEFALQVANTSVTPLNPSQLQNISTRVQVLPGDQVPIAGFIVTGTDAKKTIVRGLGPSLSDKGVSNVLGDPTLELHDSSGTRAFNDNWQDSQAQAIKDSSVPPTNDFESAIVDDLPAGNAEYTAILRGKNDTSGVGQVEVYDLDLSANSQLANISTRGYVGTGTGVLIGGFILGPSQNASTTTVIRAIGPSLSGQGVTDALADPTLELHNADGTLLASNDNWQDGPDAAQIQSVGLAPTDPKESALVLAAESGKYTAIVSGLNNSTGVALVEVYRLQQ